jgi:hypothetical protein
MLRVVSLSNHGFRRNDNKSEGQSSLAERQVSFSIKLAAMRQEAGLTPDFCLLTPTY